MPIGLMIAWLSATSFHHSLLYTDDLQYRIKINPKAEKKCQKLSEFTGVDKFWSNKNLARFGERQL